MRMLFVAGPYRAKNAAGIRRNIENARLIAEELWTQGFGVICPHLNSAFMDGVAPDRQFLEADLMMLERCCDGLVCVPGWQKSEGARGEVKRARELNLPVFERDP